MNTLGGDVTKRALWLPLSWLLGIGLFIGCPLALAQSAVKVGIVDTYTGPAAAFTVDVLDGFKLAVEERNARGGVLGEKMVYVTRDDQFDPVLGLALAKELVVREKVDLLMGTTNSVTALAVSAYAKQAKVPFFVTLAKSDRLTGEKGHRYLFNMNETSAMAGKAAALALAKKHTKSTGLPVTIMSTAMRSQRACGAT